MVIELEIEDLEELRDMLEMSASLLAMLEDNGAIIKGRDNAMEFIDACSDYVAFFDECIDFGEIPEENRMH